MTGNGGAPLPCEIAEREGLIQDIAASATFAKAPALRRLLLYLWQERAAEPSEYSIAIDALGKREDFDPKIDASVRVHVSRLRSKLKEYFEKEGELRPLRVSIPPGAHQLVWEPREQSATESSLYAIAAKWTKPVAIMLLVALCAVLLVRNRKIEKELAAARQNLVLPEIWQTILKPGRLTRVIYPMPVFHVWGDLRVRDVKNTAVDGWRTSPRLKPIVGLFGEPSAVSHSYAVSSDIWAVIELTRFLSSHGIPLEVANTNNILLHQYGNENLILLGIPPTNPTLDPYLKRTNFYLTPENDGIVNRVPKPGEPSLFRAARAAKGSTTIARHGLLVVLPGHGPNTSLILVMGLQTSAIATFISAPPSIESWTREWRKAGSPPYFEMVLLTQSDGGITKSAECVAFRTIR